MCATGRHDSTGCAFFNFAYQTLSLVYVAHCNTGRALIELFLRWTMQTLEKTSSIPVLLYFPVHCSTWWRSPLDRNGGPLDRCPCTPLQLLQGSVSVAAWQRCIIAAGLARRQFAGSKQPLRSRASVSPIAAICIPPAWRRHHSCFTRLCSESCAERRQRRGLPPMLGA